MSFVIISSDFKICSRNNTAFLSQCNLFDDKCVNFIKTYFVKNRISLRSKLHLYYRFYTKDNKCIYFRYNGFQKSLSKELMDYGTVSYYIYQRLLSENHSNQSLYDTSLVKGIKVKISWEIINEN
jgi:hypothetical protein